MKRVMVALASLAMVLAFSACDGSASTTSGSGDTSDNFGTTSTSSKGSFPSNGDPDFYCTVSKGEGWVQLKVNIPNYKGRVKKLSYDSSTDKGSQYSEVSYYGLTSAEKKEMCLEYDKDAKNDKDLNISDYYCGNGVFYMLTSVENASLYMEEFTMAEDDFEEDCKRYEREWEDGEYDDL